MKVITWVDVGSISLFPSIPQHLLTTPMIQPQPLAPAPTKDSCLQLSFSISSPCSSCSDLCKRYVGSSKHAVGHPDITDEIPASPGLMPCFLCCPCITALQCVTFALGRAHTWALPLALSPCPAMLPCHSGRSMMAFT